MNRLVEVGKDDATYTRDPSQYGPTELRQYPYFGIAGKGIIVAFLITDATGGQESCNSTRPPNGGPLHSAVGSWLHLGEDGAITVYTGKVEVGQNLRTALLQLVAEELRVPISLVQVVMGDTNRTPYDIGTFSSLSTRTVGRQVQRIAAAARELLLDLVMKDWRVERGSLTIAGSKITDANTGRSTCFADLAKGQELIQAVSRCSAMTPSSEWTTSGKPVQKAGAVDYVTGRHKFVSDLKLTNLEHGKVLRPPTFHASLRAVDTSKARAMSGVTVVQEGEFIGVTAPNEAIAVQAIASIEATWRTEAQPSQADMFSYFKKNPTQVQGPGGAVEHRVGSTTQALAAADSMLHESYTADYIAHVPLEPRAALAQWTNDNLTVWTATQRPFEVRRELAQEFRIAEHCVRVIVPDAGSAYGGKHTGDAAVEAARLAHAVGKPVKVVWTREEEFTWAYFRPAGVIDISSGVSRDSRLTAWEYHAYNTGPNAIKTPYEVANQNIQFHPARPLLRQGPYRGMAATANNFARETHMDELAALLSINPLTFRYQHLSDYRLTAVFDAAATAFGWGRVKPSPDHGFGIAGGVEKGGYVATCAEVYVDPSTGNLEVVRVAEAFECGAIISPDQLSNQVEGAIVQGLGGAIFERICFHNGTISNPSLSQYRVPRFPDTPSIEVILLDGKDLPSAGAGETPIMGIAPAIGNAIFEATGVRLRSLPLAPNGVRSNSVEHPYKDNC